LEEKCKILEVDQLLKKVKKQHEHMESAHLISQHSLRPEKEKGIINLSVILSQRKLQQTTYYGEVDKMSHKWFIDRRAKKISVHSLMLWQQDPLLACLEL
jgi:hypothetical protein